MSLHHKEHGVVLIATVIVIIFVSIAAISVGVFLANRTRNIRSDSDYIKATSLAKAGLHHAVYHYRKDGFFQLGQTYLSDGYFITSTDEANMLFFAEGTAGIEEDEIKFSVDMGNFSESYITLDKIYFSWTPATEGEAVNQIKLGPDLVFTGKIGSGETEDIDDYEIETGDYREFRIKFNTKIEWEEMTVTLIMGDASEKTFTYNRIDEEFQEEESGASLKSMGKVGDIYRTLVAEIDISDSNKTYIKNLNEINEELAP
jgi:hypothetical protein